MPSLVCSLPSLVTHDSARAAFTQVRKEMKDLSAAAQRREAARRMGTDYDTFLKAWKKPTGPVGIRPPASVVDDVVGTLAEAPAPLKSEWTTLESDIKAYNQYGLDGTRGGIKPLDPATQPTPSWSAQKAWMAGDNKGSFPYNPAIRRGMGERLGIEAPMPEKWPLPEGIERQEGAWADSFLKSIKAQTETQPPLYRGSTFDASDLREGDTFDLLPSSWSTDAGTARSYGDTVFAMRDAYGTSLNEAKLNLDDREVVAGGNLRVVSVRTLEWEQEHVDVWGGPSTFTHQKITLVELEQVSRIP